MVAESNFESNTKFSAPPKNAYHNESFLFGEAGRPVRILSEYLEPLERLRQEKIHDTVVFFGSARIRENGPLSRYYADARKLAQKLTEWTKTLDGDRRFVICSGGGSGIMEAANRGATEAGGKTIGLNISLPHEQRPNPFITPELSFEFHYFFMRKFWFTYLARALVVFPGGFGTLDELTEILTLVQTKTFTHKIAVLLYGKDYWSEVLNFRALVKYGMIDQKDLNIFEMVDDVDSAFTILKNQLPKERASHTPAIAKTRETP